MRDRGVRRDRCVRAVAHSAAPPTLAALIVAFTIAALSLTAIPSDWLASAALAADEPAAEPGPDAAQRLLIDAFVAANRARDETALRALFHDRAFDCDTPEASAGNQGTLESSFILTVPADFTVYVYPHEPGTTPGWMRVLWTETVATTHQFQLHFVRQGQSSESILSHGMVETPRGWRLTFQCLSARGVEWYRIAKTDPRAARAMARKWAEEDAAKQ